MDKYYKVTGYDNGEDIVPFYITGGMIEFIDTYGDKARYFDEVSMKEYEEHKDDEIKVWHEKYSN